MNIAPADAASLVSYELGFGPQGIGMTIHYTSATVLDPVAQEVLTRILRTKLKADHLQLVLERDLPSGGQPSHCARLRPPTVTKSSCTSTNQPSAEGLVAPTCQSKPSSASVATGA